MDIEIRIPEVGESVQEARLAEWFKATGDTVRKDEPLFLLETDKITLEVPAGADGVLEISVPAGETVPVGHVVGRIRSAAEAAEGAAPVAGEERRREEAPKPPPEKPKEPPRPAAAPAPLERPRPAVPQAEAAETLSPSVRRLIEEHRLDPGRIAGTGPGGRITRGDVMLHLEGSAGVSANFEQSSRARPPLPQGESRGEGGVRAPEPAAAGREGAQPTTRKPMSPIRKRIAERLLEAKNTTAMLTTFNEVDMTRVMELRRRHKEAFRAKHGVSLGIVSFFVKSLVGALGEHPELNASIEGEDVVYHNYCHIGVAIGAERGLVVPVIRHAERLGLAGIERAVAEYVEKIRTHRLELSDLGGGTFSVTNGGVFGSLLSTPILNPPQSGILGLHKVEDRPVAVDGQVVVRPMMYVALTYDHRIVDGRQAVQFLVRVKEEVEDPERLLLEV